MKKRINLFTFVTFVSGVVYYFTACPTVEFIDSGELALACKYLGIAHPTGYPLYTMLGRIATFFWGSLIHNVNFMSLVFTALAIGFLYLLIREIITTRFDNQISDYIAAASALIGALSPIWWAQGTTNEVYSLNLLLSTLSIWTLLKGTKSGHPRWLIISIYTLGLCLVNHLSAVYLIPGYLFLLFVGFRQQRLERRFYLWLMAALVFPVSLYLFLPIRAAFQPFLNWGGVNDLYFLYKHISGWQYRIWMFDRPLEIFNFSGKILPSIKLLLTQFGWHCLALFLIGIWSLAKTNIRILIFITIIGILNLVYVLNYDIGDIESYYLPLILLSIIFIAAGINHIVNSNFVKNIRPNIIGKAGILLFLLPLVSLFINFKVADRSRKLFAHQGVEDIAASMPDGGLALMENWDFYSPWLYLHFEEGYRPDIILLDKELMRRSWYIGFIKRNHPNIYSAAQAEFDEFLRQVEPFERGEAFNPGKIDNAYYGMINTIIAEESKKGPVFTNITDDPKIMAGMPLVPSGIMFRFHPTGEYLELPYFIFNKALWTDSSIHRDKRVGYMLSFYARAFDSRYRYALYYKRSAEADYYSKLAIETGSIVNDLK